MFEDRAVHDTVQDTEKDLRLAVALGDTLDHPMPMTATAGQMYLSARRSYSNEDSSSIFLQLIH